MIDGHSEYTVSPPACRPSESPKLIIRTRFDDQYEFSLIKDDSFRSFLRAGFPPVLEEKFGLFPKVLVEKHGQPSTTTASASGTSTPGDITVEAEPVPASQSTSTSTSAQGNKPIVEEKKSVVGGTSSVEVESRLAASAEDMWAFLTDEKRVPMWTRAPAKVRPAEFDPPDSCDDDSRATRTDLSSSGVVRGV